MSKNLKKQHQEANSASSPTNSPNNQIQTPEERAKSRAASAQAHVKGRGYNKSETSKVRNAPKKSNELAAAYEVWNKKLADSGFEDLEKSVGNGDFIPKAYSPNLNQSQKARAPTTFGYYRLCTTFLNQNTWQQWQSMFGKKASLYRKLFTMHADGSSYREIAAHFTQVMPRKDGRRRSEFWTHWNIAPVLKRMYEWHKTDPNGCLRDDEE